MPHLRSAVLLGVPAALAASGLALLGPATGPAFAGPAEPQVVVNEVMSNPDAVSDDAGEWFEVHNRGAADVSLQGWRIASGNDAVHTISAAVSVPAGGYLVLARSGAPGANGGVAAGYAYGTGVTLVNTSDWLALRDASGATVDSVAWSASPAGVSRGVRDPSADNTFLAGVNWTAQTTPYGGGDRGTPGARNDGYVAPRPDTAGASSELVVHVLDVGQGDATLVTNGSSRVLIDGGPDTIRMGKLLDSLGLNNTTIDVVVLSHPHYDHHAGLRELFRASRGITVRFFFENRDVYANTALRRLRDSVDARAARGQLVLRDTDDPCANGTALCTITLNGGAKLHVMRPNPKGTTPNNRSTPLKLVGPDSASFSMWLAGDAEHEALGWFDTGADYDVFPGMKVNVVKGNHHGSCNGVRSRFVQLTDPDWVVFSLAARNDYGHVHRQTRALYTAFGKPWYRTDQNGTITLRSPGTPGGGYTVTPMRNGSSLPGPVDRASTQGACNPLS